MLTTDCIFLENELMDVVRLFKSRPLCVKHSFRFENGAFYNDFAVDGQAYSFKDEGQVSDEIEYKRLERRFAKLGLYAILSDLYGEKMPRASVPPSSRTPKRRRAEISFRSLKKCG